MSSRLCPERASMTTTGDTASPMSMDSDVSSARIDPPGADGDLEGADDDLDGADADADDGVPLEGDTVPELDGSERVVAFDPDPDDPPDDEAPPPWPLLKETLPPEALGICGAVKRNFSFLVFDFMNDPSGILILA